MANAASRITALLGPTNTGKTHRAVERMLEHRSGMIGLPLRLLAREVYDRVSSRVGEQRVALVTGEEKRVPRRPDYWICTVEAMPVEREVDFVAVDEIQMAEHPQRGHVFTDRMLRARGALETWLLGSASMRQIMAKLVPTAQQDAHPRLSQLRFTGEAKLSKLPLRSAVVGFSTTQVYELAERIRERRGGAAVVLGALSPRTRNAQVAMFQAGEVGYLVATDAIGMGLNLAVRHVAFAATRKFDGQRPRPLELSELSQIAGRAGRHLEDGSFGTLAPVALPADTAAAIEEHRFPPVTRIYWRNPDLDFTSLGALLASLRAPPRSARLRRVEHAEDGAALELLARDAGVRRLASSGEGLALLWQVCAVPDFRKLLLEAHAALLGTLYAQLTGPRGVLDEDWVGARVRELDDPLGDLDTLLGRIAAVRTFTYIAHRPGWLLRPEPWQEATRAIEDRLSDALHERLVERFVERGQGRRGSAGPRPRPRSGPSAEPQAPALPPSHPFAALLAMRAALSPSPEPAASGAMDGGWVDEIIDAPHSRFGIDGAGRICFDDGAPLAQVVRGPRIDLPEIKLTLADDLGAGARARLSRRLLACARDVAASLLEPLRRPESRTLSPRGAGLLYLLEQGLGTVLVQDARPEIAALGAKDRETLRALEIEVGMRVVYLPALLEAPALARRAALVTAFFGRETGLPPGFWAGASFELPRKVNPRALTAAGFPPFGTRALRADVAERVLRALRPQATPAERPDMACLAGWMDCAEREVPWIADDLGAGRW